MISVKRCLNVIAAMLRLLSKAIDNWPWVLLIISIISPISPHVRLPYAVSYSDCAYFGTRGVMRPASADCPIVAIINTETQEIIRW